MWTQTSDFRPFLGALLLLLLTACAADPQVPGGGVPYEVRPFGDRYALAVDRSTSRPLEIWDLSYPILERDDPGETETHPVRLVNFQEPGEMQQILVDEKWRFGVRSWFAGIATFGILKWFMTGDLFDVREMRNLRRGMLRQHLLDGGGAGLDPGSYQSALVQLEHIPRPEFEEYADRNYQWVPLSASGDVWSWLVEAASPEPPAHPLDPAVWERLKAAILDGGRAQARIETHPLGEVAAIAEKGLKWVDQLEIRYELFGEHGHLALAHVRFWHLEAPAGIYELGHDAGPLLVVSLARPYHDPAEKPVDLSLALNMMGAAGVVGSGLAIGQAVGFPFPFIGLTINTVTSIRPTQPLLDEDPVANARGRLIAMLERTDPAGPPLPRFLAENRQEVLDKIRAATLAGNRYWLDPDRSVPLAQQNRTRLAGHP